MKNLDLNHKFSVFIFIFFYSTLSQATIEATLVPANQSNAYCVGASPQICASTWESAYNQRYPNLTPFCYAVKYGSTQHNLYGKSTCSYVNDSGQALLTLTCPSGSIKSTYDSSCYSCPTDSEINWSTQSPTCNCVNGTVEQSGFCVPQQTTCTSSQLNIVCSPDGTFVCTGTFEPEFTCYLSVADAPQGCESGTKTFLGCSGPCPGDSTFNADNTACIDPECIGQQTLQNHTCINPTCEGDQTLIEGTCLDPECIGDQELVNHVCQDPTCIGDDVVNFEYKVCQPPDSCSNQSGGSYQYNDVSHKCEFSGCATGYTTGTVNGQQTCVKSGDTVNGTATSTTANNETSTTTTTNPDGSTSTSETTTTGTSTTTTEISLDTEGLAQESTNLEILDQLKNLTGEAADYDNQSAESQVQTQASENANSLASELTGTSNPFDGMTSGSAWMPSLPTDTSCSGSIPITWKGNTTYFSPCEKLAPLREVLAWVFYVITVLYIFHLMFKTRV